MASSPAAWKKKSATEVSQALANKKHQQLREEDEMWASGEVISSIPLAISSLLACNIHFAGGF